MNVLCHRGDWRSREEMNGMAAFQRAFTAGFGIELDLRSRDGELVVSHDPPLGPTLAFSRVCDALEGLDLVLAVNIKEDGLAAMLARQMRGAANWFVFDMSVPELLRYIALGLPAFSRASEFEREPACYGEVAGVWLDSFGPEWYGPREVERFLADGKRVCIVSPELHGREPEPFWAALRARGIHKSPALMLCTDLAERAQRFFGDAP